MNLSLQSFETGNLSADNFKNTRPRWVNTWARGTVWWYWSAGALFWQLSIDHNIDVQLVFPWAPKLARKCESRHWFPCGADGRSYGHVITKFSRMGRLPHFLTYGAPPTHARFARGWSSAINKIASRHIACIVFERSFSVRLCPAFLVIEKRSLQNWSFLIRRSLLAILIDDGACPRLQSKKGSSTVYWAQS